MTDEVGLGNAQPRRAKQPTRRSQPPLTVPQQQTCSCGNPSILGVVHRTDGPCYHPDESRAAAAESVNSRHAIPDDLAGQPAEDYYDPPAPSYDLGNKRAEARVVNPYAPTGWRKKQRLEFDLELPSGQLCRVMRLERDDVMRMGLMEYLNTFAPMLMDQALSDEERQTQMQEKVQDDPKALGDMLDAIDKVVMTCCVKPRVTQDPKLVNYGDEEDWGDPNFTPVAYLDDIDSFEKMYIFGAAFGSDMDHLKSVLQQAQSMAGMGSQPSVQPTTE